MISEMTTELFQAYQNDSETVRVDVLYNNTKDFFYFNMFVNGVLERGDTRIVNGYNDGLVSFSSLSADHATFADVESFKIEVFDV